MFGVGLEVYDVEDPRKKRAHLRGSHSLVDHQGNQGTLTQPMAYACARCGGLGRRYESM